MFHGDVFIRHYGDIFIRHCGDISIRHYGDISVAWQKKSNFVPRLEKPGERDSISIWDGPPTRCAKELFAVSTRARASVTYCSLHWLSLGSGEGLGGKFCGAYCPTRFPPLGWPSRIKSRLCPPCRSDAPGSERSFGSALGISRVDFGSQAQTTQARKRGEHRPGVYRTRTSNLAREAVEGVAHQSEWCNKAFLPPSTDAKFVSS